MLRKAGYALGKAQSRRPWLFIIAALVITLLTLPGIPMLLQNVEPSLEKVLPQDLEEVAVMNQMRSQYGADMLYLVLETDGLADPFDPESLAYIDTLTQSVRDIQDVRDATGLADILREHGPLPATRDAAQAVPDPRIGRYVSAEHAVSVIMVRADTGADAERVAAVIADLHDAIDALEGSNPGYTVSVTGFGAIDQATFAVIISDFTRITLISFALMILYLLVHYRGSVKKTVYSMLIMVFALIWALGITGYIGLQLDVVTMVAAAMIMALGSSYGINSVYHFYDDFLLQYPKEEAVARFQEFLIIGLTGSALAEIAGFLALLFGIMPSMQALGIILAIGILMALLVSVMVLPACFYLMEKGVSHGTSRR